MLSLINNFLKELKSSIANNLPEVLKESGKDISISTDLFINKKIIDFLSDNFNYPILSEENAIQFNFENCKETFWIIDPLDGSLNFAKKIPLNCISIALVHEQKIAFGIIYDFNHDELFVGNCFVNPICSDIFAHLNNKSIAVSTISNHNQSILCTGFPSYRSYDETSLLKFVKQVQDFKKVRCLGSAALSLAWVACGRTEAYFEEDIRIWDVAAGLAITKAAGGKYFIKKGKAENFVNVIAHNNCINFNL